MQNAAEKLLEIEAIKQLKARYFRTVDTFDLAGWLECFTQDCHLLFDAEVRSKDGSEPQQFDFRGREEVAGFWASNANRVSSVHHGHMPEIELLSQNEAKGIWAMEDIVEFTDSLMHGYGHYHETYRKENGAWRIATLHLTRLRLSQTPIVAAP